MSVSGSCAFGILLFGQMSLEVENSKIFGLHIVFMSLDCHLLLSKLIRRALCTILTFMCLAEPLDTCSSLSQPEQGRIWEKNSIFNREINSFNSYCSDIDIFKTNITYKSLLKDALTIFNDEFID